MVVWVLAMDVLLRLSVFVDVSNGVVVLVLGGLALGVQMNLLLGVLFALMLEVSLCWRGGADNSGHDAA